MGGVIIHVCLVFSEWYSCDWHSEYRSGTGAAARIYNWGGGGGEGGGGASQWRTLRNRGVRRCFVVGGLMWLTDRPSWRAKPVVCRGVRGHATPPPPPPPPPGKFLLSRRSETIILVHSEPHFHCIVLRLILWDYLWSKINIFSYNMSAQWWVEFSARASSSRLLSSEIQRHRNYLRLAAVSRQCSHACTDSCDGSWSVSVRQKGVTLIPGTTVRVTWQAYIYSWRLI